MLVSHTTLQSLPLSLPHPTQKQLTTSPMANGCTMQVHVRNPKLSQDRVRTREREQCPYECVIVNIAVARESTYGITTSCVEARAKNRPSLLQPSTWVRGCRAGFVCCYLVSISSSLSCYYSREREMRGLPAFPSSSSKPPKLESQIK